MGRFLVGNIMMVIVTIIFGMELTAQKWLIPDAMSAIDVAVWRMVAGAALFWLAAMVLRPQKIQKGDWKSIIWGGVFQFGFMWGYAVAVQFGSIIDVALVMTIQPTLIIVANAVFHKYRVSRAEVWGMVLSLAGAVFVIVSGGGSHTAHASDPLLGDLMAFVTSVCYSGYICVTQGVSKKYKPTTLDRWLFLVAAALCVPFLFHLPQAPIFHQLDWRWIGSLAFVVVLASFACYFMIPPSIRDIGGDLVGIYSYLVPVVAAVVAVLTRTDTMRWDQPVAFVVIIAGVIIISRAKRKLKREGKLLRGN